MIGQKLAYKNWVHITRVKAQSKIKAEAKKCLTNAVVLKRAEKFWFYFWENLRIIKAFFSVARKFRAENTKGEPQNTKKNTTLKTKKHHVFGYKNTKYLIKSFKNGPPKHFYCIFVHQFLKNFNFYTEIFQKISIFF